MVTKETVGLITAAIGLISTIIGFFVKLIRGRGKGEQPSEDNPTNEPIDNPYFESTVVLFEMVRYASIEDDKSVKYFKDAWKKLYSELNLGALLHIAADGKIFIIMQHQKREMVGIDTIKKLIRLTKDLNLKMLEGRNSLSECEGYMRVIIDKGPMRKDALTPTEEQFFTGEVLKRINYFLADKELDEYDVKFSERTNICGVIGLSHAVYIDMARVMQNDVAMRNLGLSNTKEIRVTGDHEIPLPFTLFTIDI